MSAKKGERAGRESVQSAGVIPPAAHRVLDFVTVLAFAAAPAALGLTGLPAFVSYALAVVHLVLTLLTRFSADGGQPVAFRVHGAVEMLVGPVLLAAPFLLGWQGVARTFFLAAGVVILAVWALTSYGGHSHAPS
jgi:hypothetical protein